MSVYARGMSAYAKLPSKEPDTGEHPRVSEAVARAEKLASAVGSAVSSSVGTGLQKASRALEGPAGADVEALIADSNLPEVDADDPLAALARRLDREADLWRNLAIRELAHVAWANRIAHAASIVAIVGVVSLAFVAALGALFGGSSGGRALLVGVAAAVLSLGALVATWTSGGVRRSQREIVRDALARADLAELRLHRIAMAMASCKADPEHARDVLARLEKDANG